jgi:hypothetical protein
VYVFILQGHFLLLHPYFFLTSSLLLSYFFLTSSLLLLDGTSYLLSYSSHTRNILATHGHPRPHHALAKSRTLGDGPAVWLVGF